MMGGGLGMGFGGIFGLLLLGIIIWAVIKIVVDQNTSNNNKKISSGNNAMEILKSRYAAGEISKNEFEKIKEDLE